MDVNSVLKERGSRYGAFIDQAAIEQNIKSAFHNSPNWDKLAPDAKSSLEMIATKISRILLGDPDYADSWVDISGYAQLIVNRINK